MSAFDWLQLVFLFLFVALSLWKTLDLKRKGTSVWVMARDGRGKERSAVGIFFLAGLAAWFGLIALLATGHGDLLPRFLSRPLLAGTAPKIAAVVLSTLALALNLLGLLALGDNWRVGVDPGQPGDLVTRGVYSFSRNPIMVCTFLYALAVWLTYSNVLMLLVFLVVALGVPYQVRREEAFLRERHGERYLEYQRRVGRYLSFPRRRGSSGSGSIDR